MPYTRGRRFTDTLLLHICLSVGVAVVPVGRVGAMVCSGSLYRVPAEVCAVDAGLGVEADKQSL